MNNKYHNQYRIPSARATWHDYNGGAYFITICTRRREHFFGEIVQTMVCKDDACASTALTTEPAMQFTEVGRYADELLMNITWHNPYCEIPLWVVMPNHIHAIVFIDIDGANGIHRDGACTVSTGERWQNKTVNEKMQQISLYKGSLSIAIGSFKSAVTRFTSENGIEFAWQTRFHDRIIRDGNEMSHIAEYIENNVASWNTDCYN
jgi:REP element-mobilizing transposase RayT